MSSNGRLITANRDLHPIQRNDFNSSGIEVNSGGELNVFGGGIGGLFFPGSFGTPILQANNGSEVNILGGRVSDFVATSGSYVTVAGGSVNFYGLSGGEVAISGGHVESGFSASPGSRVTISGGSIGPLVSLPSGSNAEIIGGDFRMNGESYSATSVTLAPGDVFSGRYSDGNAFVFYDDANNIFKSDTLESVALTKSPLPEISVSPMELSSPSGAPTSLNSGQVLIVQEGGFVGGDFKARDAVLLINGGSVAGSVRFEGSLISMNSGRFSGYNGLATLGTVVNVRGGIVGGFDVQKESRLNVTGGIIDGYFGTASEGKVSISGGFIRQMKLPVAGDVTIGGGEYQLNGTPGPAHIKSLAEQGLARGSCYSNRPYASYF